MWANALSLSLSPAPHWATSHCWLIWRLDDSKHPHLAFSVQKHVQSLSVGFSETLVYSPTSVTYIWPHPKVFLLIYLCSSFPCSSSAWASHVQCSLVN